MAKKKMKRKSATTRPVSPKSKMFLKAGVIVSLSGRIISPGDAFTEGDVTADRLRELKEKGLVRTTLTTEEKGTITK